MFQWSVDFFFVVIEGDDVSRFWGRWVFSLVFGGLVVGDGYKVCFDSCIKGVR